MARTTIILLAILVAVGMTSAFAVLADAVLGKVILLIVLELVLMTLGVALRPHRDMPLLCDPFLLYSVFIGQFFVIGPVAMAVWGLSPVVFFYAPGLDAAIVPLLACLAMLAFSVLGYWSDLGASLARMLPEFRGRVGQFAGGWGVVALAGAGALGCLGWLQYQGGLLAKLGKAYGNVRSGDAVFAVAFHGIVAGSVLWAWYLFDRNPASRKPWAAFWAFLAVEAVFFGVLYGARKFLLFIFFGVLACWLLRRGTARLPKLRLAALLALLMVFFSVWGSIRHMPLSVLAGSGSDARYAAPDDLSSGYVTGVADPFGGACLIWQIFPAYEPFRHGRTLLVTVLGFIPRAVWPEKPVGFGKELSKYYVGPFYEHDRGHSAAATLPGDFYVNFGWPGVLAGGFLAGLVCRIAAAYATQGMRNGIQTRAARVVLASLFIAGLGEVRADTSQMLAFYILTMVPTIAILLVFRMDGGAADAVPDAGAAPTRAA